MGTYADTDAIAAEYKALTLSATSTPTTTQVDEFITQAEALLEGEVANLYVVPITGTKSIAIMKMMTILLVKARMLDRGYVKSGSESADQGDPGEALREQVMGEDGMLAKILDKRLRLVDATLNVSSGGVYSYNDANNICPQVEKETNEW